MRAVVRTTIAIGAVLASAGAATITALPASAAQATQAHRTAHPSATKFAMRGWAYGTRVLGGDIPVSSAPTAYEALPCTNRAGIVRTNHLVTAKLPSLGTISGVQTRAWTTRKAGVVSSWSRNTIGKVVLSDSPLGTLYLDAVSTTARAFHDGTRFRTSTHTDVARLRFQGPAGPAMTLPLPAPNRPVEIPGFATVTIAKSVTGTNSRGAHAAANGILVKLHATKSTVGVARAVSFIYSGVRSGLFNGKSYGLSASAASNVLNVGPNPLLKLRCVGTRGKVQTSSLAGINLGDQVVVHAAKNEQMGNQTSRHAWGFERSKVASVNIGDGQLRIEGIVGQANVSRRGPKLRTFKRSTAGTSTGKIYVNGKLQQFPDTGVLQIPGVAKIQAKVVKNIRSGISVTALRVTLLDGTGAVLNLGTAELKVRRILR
ncbi:choice-of-anchor P family protein [Nocardioides sp. URHA0020]|uniref:choice-of-anchor P family protein n=1 Tax=Nocardioides sp. URHA0020 TaxID=1380392 RepID=UPI00048B4832|nr:choice-of-anchor P family protein [Nocardioides sp. URHA0020]